MLERPLGIHNLYVTRILYLIESNPVNDKLKQVKNFIEVIESWNSNQREFYKRVSPKLNEKYELVNEAQLKAFLPNLQLSFKLKDKLSGLRYHTNLAIYAAYHGEPELLKYFLETLKVPAFCPCVLNKSKHKGNSISELMLGYEQICMAKNNKLKNFYKEKEEAYVEALYYLLINAEHLGLRNNIFSIEDGQLFSKTLEKMYLEAANKSDEQRVVFVRFLTDKQLVIGNFVNDHSDYVKRLKNLVDEQQQHREFKEEIKKQNTHLTTASNFSLFPPEKTEEGKNSQSILSILYKDNHDSTDLYHPATKTNSLEQLKKLLEDYPSLIFYKNKQEQSFLGCAISSAVEAKKQNKEYDLAIIDYLLSTQFFEFSDAHNTIKCLYKNENHSEVKKLYEQIMVLIVRHHFTNEKYLNECADIYNVDLWKKNLAGACNTSENSASSEKCNQFVRKFISSYTKSTFKQEAAEIQQYLLNNKDKLTIHDINKKIKNTSKEAIKKHMDKDLIKSTFLAKLYFISSELERLLKNTQNVLVESIPKTLSAPDNVKNKIQKNL